VNLIRKDASQKSGEWQNEKLVSLQLLSIFLTQQPTVQCEVVSRNSSSSRGNSREGWVVVVVDAVE